MTVHLGRHEDGIGLVPKPALHKTEVALLAAANVCGGAPGQKRQPTPELCFGFADSDVFHGAKECLLLGFGRGIFVTAADHQEIPLQPEREGCMKLSPRELISGGQSPSERGCRRLDRRPGACRRGRERQGGR